METWKTIAYDYLAGLATALNLETEQLEVTLIDKFSLQENRERKIVKNSLQLEIAQYEELGGLKFVECKNNFSFGFLLRFKCLVKKRTTASYKNTQ